MTQKNKKISSTPYVGIVGMGYVGLPLAREFCKGGAKVLGFDVKAEQVRKLNNGKSPLKHIPNSDVREMVGFGLLSWRDREYLWSHRMHRYLQFLPD